jgi:hypothetical protein
MQSVAKLAEGMRRYDLEDLVLPLVSVDEFESKVDSSAIVFGFYVHDQAAANDLNRFLQKAPVEILDTDVSPAPDQRGYFLVFVEMRNDDMVAKNILSVCEDIENITGIRRWQMRLRGSPKILPLSPEPIVRHLARERRANENGVLEFLMPSKLRSAQLNEGYLTLNGSDSYGFVDFGDIDFLLECYDLKDETLQLDPYIMWKCSKVRRHLGEGWSVDQIGAYQIIHRDGSERGILLRG